MIKLFKYYLPAIIWMGVIFYLSSLPDLQMGSSSVTFEVIARKIGHFLEYSILLWLIWRIFYYAWNLINRDALILAILFSLFYAISDEFHQTFIPGRTGQFIDVLFDFLSALFASQLIIVAIGRTLKKYIFFVIAIISLGLAGLIIKMVDDGNRVAENTVIFSGPVDSTDNNKSNNNNSDNFGTGTTQPQDNKSDNNKPIPERVLIKVPFTPQAPYAQWDQFHEEACEEASLIMVKYFLDGKSLDQATAEDQIQKLIKFEIQKYGDYVDSNAAQIVAMGHDFYGLNNLKVVYDFKKDDLKKYLSRGKPIIIPAAGQLLGNPNFKYPGPPYHALVMIGYDGNTIITNDPGTRKGEGYRYNIDTLYNAIHDFPGNRDKITDGRKAMIIIE